MVRVLAVAAGSISSIGAICAMLPLLTKAVWTFVGGAPNVQFPSVNQFSSVVGPCQTSCAYNAEDPIKRKFRLNITEHHLTHRVPAKNRLKNRTSVSHIKFLRDIATFVSKCMT